MPRGVEFGLSDSHRWAMLSAMDAAAALGHWNTPPAPGRFRGIAIGTAFNSIVAMVVELSTTTTTSSTGVTSTSIKIRKVSAALDSYLVVNPGSVEAQIEGGIVHAINAKNPPKPLEVRFVMQSFPYGIGVRKGLVDIHRKAPLKAWQTPGDPRGDRKSTRLNSSHVALSRMPSSA